MPAVQDVLADAEIRSLLPRERYYRDTGEWKKMRNCYHPDARKTSIALSWYTGDIEGWISISKKMWAVGQATGLIHTLVPGEVTVRGTKALSISTCQIVVRHEHEGTEFDISSWIRLVSKLERVEVDGCAEWRMLSLEAVYLRDSIALTGPSGEAGLRSMNFDLLKRARQSYKYISWHLSLYGSHIGGDLPGSDEPKSVEDLLTRNYAWVESI